MAEAGWLIDCYDIDDARERIFGYLQSSYCRGGRVIYYDGWSGLGASAVLRSVAELLPSMRTTPGLCFDRIIHVDCSEWKNRRLVQRAIAEELEFDSLVMAILDKQDEEDDFDGVDESSRHEIASISMKINHILKDIRFVVIFHNGSDNEIDLYGLGVPRFEVFDELMDSRILWTFRKRLFTMRHYKEKLGKLRSTDFFPYALANYLSSEEFYAILCKEAAIIVASYPCMREINQAMVADCCLYKLFMHSSFYNTTRSDWAGHASNCWICDGILQEDITSEISTTLHREIGWECDASLLDTMLKKFKKHLKLPFLVVKDDGIYEEGPYRWISITSVDKKEHGIQTIPVETSSFSLAFERSDPRALPNRLFKQSSNLGVLILYWCAFNFASPQFLKCHSLRFLGLDHCADDKTGEGEDQTKWLCLYSLQVLDLRYTDWNEILSQEKLGLMTNIRELNIVGVMCWQYTTRLQGRLPNLKRLRIIKPTRGPEASIDTSNSFLDKTKLQTLDLSGNSEMEILPNSLSKSSSLQVLVLDGCNGLEDVVIPDGIPCSLRSFSFDGHGSASKWTPLGEIHLKQICPSTTTNKKGANVSKISLGGCTQLENMFIRGLRNLVELDLSGTPIKILDFNTMVVEVPRLKRLFLLGCQHLRAIKQGKMSVIHLKLLCIDTRAGIVYPRPSLDQNKSFQLQIHAIFADARLVRSLGSLTWGSFKDIHFNIHVTSLPLYCGFDQLKATCKEKIGLYDDRGSLQQLVPADRYGDVLSTVGDTPMQAFPQPPATTLDRHIEIAEGSQALESELTSYLNLFTLADIISQGAQSLHVHDVSTSVSLHVIYWYYLKQCRIERCPKLDTVFHSRSKRFDELETLWVSDLLMACWICSKGRRYELSSFNEPSSFRYLQHLHLRSCPRLQFVLPVWVSSFPSLETIHIIDCSDLKHIFVLDDKFPEKVTVYGVSFPKLTTIHLHDLPMLRQICEVKMVAPVLETIKIRGCWGMHRLPVVEARGPDMKKPTVEIEEDVWDALQWDGVEAGHHHGYFEAPIHSRYYKEKLPRVSYLR